MNISYSATVVPLAGFKQVEAVIGTKARSSDFRWRTGIGLQLAGKRGGKSFDLVFKPAVCEGHAARSHSRTAQRTGDGR
jgi:hypothetical protein